MTSPNNRDARERLAAKVEDLILSALYDAPHKKPPAGSDALIGVLSDDIAALLSPDEVEGMGSDQPLLSVATGHPEQGALLSGWRSMDTAPMPGENEPRVPVLLAWNYRDGTMASGEAYWHPTDPEGGAWWWANTEPGDYFSSDILDGITGQIVAWMPIPDPPSLPADGTGRAPSPPQTAEAVPGMNNNPQDER